MRVVKRGKSIKFSHSISLKAAKARSRQAARRTASEQTLDTLSRNKKLFNYSVGASAGGSERVSLLTRSFVDLSTYVVEHHEVVVEEGALALEEVPQRLLALALVAADGGDGGGELLLGAEQILLA